MPEQSSGKGVKGPCMIDLDLWSASGINPRTGQPDRIGFAPGQGTPALYEEIVRQLTIRDEQEAINAGIWYNTPKGLTQELIERILYYRGQGIFTRINGEFVFLPYALAGTIDIYGRYLRVKPLPFNGVTDEYGETDYKKETSAERGHRIMLSMQERVPVYTVALPEDYILDDGNVDTEAIEKTMDEACVIIRDYSPAISQVVVPRSRLMRELIRCEATFIPYMRTALLNSTGVLAMRVMDETEQANVAAASRIVDNAALVGMKYIPVTGSIDFQELTGNNIGKAQEFLLAMQAVDNYRRSLHGIGSGGLMQKSEHMLQSEQEMNEGNTGLVQRDKTWNRQTACNIINSIWDIGIWYEPSEPVTGEDYNNDGVEGSDDDGGTTGQGNQEAGDDSVD